MSDRILISTRKGLFDLRRKGADDWSIKGEHFMGSAVTFCLPTHDRLHVSITDGHFGPKLWASTDGGTHWTETPAPALSEGHEKSVEMIWVMADDGAGRLWAGTIPGALFSSDNEGASWQLNEPLWNQPSRSEWFGGGYDEAGIHSICIDPRNNDHVTIAISCAGVWRTEDAGASWELRTDGLRAEFLPPDAADGGVQQDPHQVVQCAAAPDTLWMQHHNGIFKSTDLGKQWTEIDSGGPSNFGFGVAVHPADPDRAWFVPGIKDEYRYPKDGKLVVTRTRDGGTSFDVLSKGLPDAASYDLIYRHALAIDQTGERLVMGSTTGGVWITEDGGDHWHHLPERFPPVAAVTFA
jgi:photosystem II stability/assembly factor-like uncharacterized protein